MRITRQTFLAAILFSLVILGLIAAAHNLLLQSQLGMNDFLSRWAGAQTYWLQGESPYGPTAAMNIQRLIYGGPAPPDADPSLFAYPFYMAFFVWPLVYLEYSWAAAIWMVILSVLLVGLLLLMLDLLRWRPDPLHFLLLIAVTIFNYPSARGFFLGQPSHVVIFLQMLSLWAVIRRRDGVAGAALALSTIKPQMNYLLIPFLLAWAAWERRWQVWYGFLGVLAVLFGLSFLLLPSWLAEWTAAIFNYTGYTANDAATQVLLVRYLGLPSGSEWALNVLLYGVGLWYAYTVIIRSRHERLLWTGLLLVVIMTITGPRVGTAHFAMYVIVMTTFYMARQRRLLGNTLLAAAVIVLPWAYFLATVQGNAEDQSITIPVPVIALLILLWDRRRWWQAGFAPLGFRS